MKDYTLIKNPILRASQLTINARYLLCVLLRYCGKKEYCYPSLKTLGADLGLSPRQVSVYIDELIDNGLVTKTRTGFDRSNTYKVAKSFIVENEEVVAAYKKSASNMDEKSDSAHIRSAFPLHSGSELPPNNTYLIVKDNNSYKVNPKTWAKFRTNLEERGIIPKTKPILKKEKLTLQQSGNIAEVLRQKTKKPPFKRESIESNKDSSSTDTRSLIPPYEQKDSCGKKDNSVFKKTVRYSNPIYRVIDASRIE
ncbi:MAG: hypothetical protein BWY24_00166 [Microgenomates group bacterium ADurb.Bin219]|nr:MAG: hypothetical protein BWY24_00166 [Microgenomates group bacterium ADurb.Bin219]HNP89616.1 helix-turn-helix domain-containing protein [Candidatus Woesebacteria bacterium]